MNNPLMCSVCGFPPSACELVFLTWTEDESLPMDNNGLQLRLQVSQNPSASTPPICTSCIRGIKRIPFSDFASTDIAF